jgi:microcompartment protein CcmL/EutN
MLEQDEGIGSCLLPMLVAGCIGAVGLSMAPGATAAGTVAELISGLSINHAADRLPALLNALGSKARREVIHDLDRVTFSARHFLMHVFAYRRREWPEIQRSHVLIPSGTDRIDSYSL